MPIKWHEPILVPFEGTTGAGGDLGIPLSMPPRLQRQVLRITQVTVKLLTSCMRVTVFVYDLGGVGKFYTLIDETVQGDVDRYGAALNWEGSKIVPDLAENTVKRELKVQVNSTDGAQTMRGFLIYQVGVMD